MNDFAQRAEAALLWLIYQLFRLLPLDAASGFGGWFGRVVGPRIGATRRAKRNLALALPDADHQAIIRGMWENLGRMAGEYPHHAQLAEEAGRMEILGIEHFEAARREGKPILFFSGHVGNWELTFPLMARLGIRANGVFRAPNNPHLGWLFDRTSKAYPDLGMIPKGAAGARRSLEALSKGVSLVMFVDQKMNDGISVPFFGRPAMTAPALAALAMKFESPVLPFRINRMIGSRFRVQFFPPFHFARSEDRAADQVAAMTEVNTILEDWIREFPAQWLWLHRRWPNDAV